MAFISTCTALWSPSISTTAKAKSWPACARSIGKDVPLVVSLDLHANVTPEMVKHADALIAYRTYPHVDMADTGRACARHLALL